MENIHQKYRRLRNLINDGDLILFHGTGIIARTIQAADSSYYNHIGIVFKKCGALYIVDANADGVQADRLSRRINKYKNGGDFTIVKPLRTSQEIETALVKLLTRSDEKTIKYDLFNGIKELINRRFNTNFEITKEDGRDICSDFVSQYQVDLNIVTEEFKGLRIAFPEDTIRHKNDFVLVIN
jgi:hypothetical protein